jgi:TDG/mug DNA glycosylase family protein
MARVAAEGFPPVARGDARVLVLGSLPGARSIALQQYYAHPQNAFWPIMRELFGIGGDYASRCDQLLENRVALWDVLHRSVRPGSMDADIQLGSAVANDFHGFLGDYADIRLIVFNGKKAEQLFTRLVGADDVVDGIVRVGLPSTSPAYASMPFSGKLAAWRIALSEGS